PGQYALGRALLVLDDREAARKRLEAAWAQGYREPRVAWALAQVLGDLYQERLLLDVERRSPEQRELRRRELEQNYRDPALAYLRQAEGPDVPVPPLYVKALFAFYEGRHEEALAYLEDMGRAQPWFYEAPLLQGDVLLARATQRWHQGDKAGSQEDVDAGRRAYTAAIATAESQPTGHYVLARLELAALVMELYGEGNVLPYYERGVEAATRALTAAPDHHRSLVVLSRLHRRLAEQRTGQGREDAEPLLEKSILAAREALALAPPGDRVALELAITHRLWARYRQERGQDPSEQLRQSIEAFERLRPEERDYAFHANLGLTYQVWADAEAERGVDPLAHQGKAIDAYLAAIRVRENQADAWINLGNALRRRASTPGATDAAGDLTKARDALAKALALNPGNVVACFRGAEISEQLARWRWSHGEPHEADLEQALALFRQGLGINAKLPPLHNGLGAALLWQAEQRWEEGGDTEPLLQQAQAAFEEARRLAPKQAYAHNNLGEVWMRRATIQAARGEDPRPSGRAAVEAYQQAVSLQEKDADLWANLGRAQTLLATWSLESGGDPGQELSRAEASLARASSLNARQAHIWRNTGELRARKARWLARRDTAKDSDFEAAAEAFQQALTLAPRRHDFRLEAARFQLAWAEWRQRAGVDSGPTGARPDARRRGPGRPSRLGPCPGASRRPAGGAGGHARRHGAAAGVALRGPGGVAAGVGPQPAAGARVEEPARHGPRASGRPSPALRRDGSQTSGGSVVTSRFPFFVSSSLPWCDAPGPLGTSTVNGYVPTAAPSATASSFVSFRLEELSREMDAVLSRHVGGYTVALVMPLDVSIQKRTVSPCRTLLLGM
ncbi:hypothetical protein ACLEPN_29950, partial [Myxococcus sp. 1LA]